MYDVANLVPIAGDENKTAKVGRRLLKESTMSKQNATPSSLIREHPLAILRLRQVKARTGRCRSSIYSDIKAGRFPAPVAIGARSVGWVSHEIDNWIYARIAESRGSAK